METEAFREGLLKYNGVTVDHLTDMKGVLDTTKSYPFRDERSGIRLTHQHPTMASGWEEYLALLKHQEEVRRYFAQNTEYRRLCFDVIATKRYG